MSVNILVKRSATASKRPVGASMVFGELNLNYDASTGGLYYKDSAGGVVKVGPCQVSATAPNSSPAGSAGNSTGEFWFDSSTNTLKVYDGSAWVETGGSVQGVTGTAPITVDNTDPLNPIVGISAASTSASGAVQLNDTTSSTSTTEALTAAQGKNLQDQIDALIISSNLTLAGTLNATTGNLVTVTTEGTAQGFAVGSPLPSPAAGNAEFFVIATVGATSYTPPGGSPVLVHVGDWFLSNGTVWNLLDVGFQAPSASTTVEGVVFLATDAEVQAGIDTSNKAVNPNSLQSKVSDSISTISSFSIASSTAVKSAYDLADAAVPDASFTAAGDLLVGSGAGTYAALASGPADYILASDGSGGLSWVQQSEGDVIGVTGTAPITVDNTDPQNPVVGINAASTSAAGAVQLNDTVTSTSTTEAGTANAVKTAYDAAVTAQATNPFAADNVLFVNSTDGNNATAARGTARPYSTLTAALAAASEGDFIYISAGTLTENVVINKGVTIQGTYQDQGTWQGTKILGNAQINLSASIIRNLSINNVYFISVNSTPVLRVVAHATGAGNTIISNCGFTQQTATDVNQFAYSSDAVNWTRAIYMRNCLFDGNVKHNAGTAAGASGYLVFDGTIGAGSSNYYYQVLTGTVEFRSPTNAISPIYQTGGVVTTRNVTSWTNNSATTTTIFGGTGFNYKGSAASVGTGTIYFGGGYNTVGGKVDIGANLVYGWTNLNVTPANLTVNGSAVAYTTAVPSSAGVVVAQQTRPRYDLLTTSSSVAAANQLGTVVDSATGIFYSVTTYDAGQY